MMCSHATRTTALVSVAFKMAAAASALPPNCVGYLVSVRRAGALAAASARTRSDDLDPALP